MVTENWGQDGDNTRSDAKRNFSSGNPERTGKDIVSWLNALPTANGLPEGTVTFLFSDIEGSTPLWERHPQMMAEALEIHNTALGTAIASHGGIVFKTVGDAFQAVFPTAPQALNAAVAGQRHLKIAPWNELGSLKVRMGLHTGEAVLDPGGDEYAVSHAKNRVARVMSAGHGGQILLSQECADLCKRTLPEGIRFKDLGLHRLKGLSVPEHLYQVIAPDLEFEFPPLLTLATCLNNLPLQLTSFIGRETEMVQICALLYKNRLVTLTGAGGIGKTRLSLRVAESLIGDMPGASQDFEHGIWLLELATLVEPELVTRAIASIFGVHEDQNRTLLEALLDYLSEKNLLLIFDNCEHLIAKCTELADIILRSCPGVKILATSREVLGIEGETAFYVPSLNSPDPENLPPASDLPAYQAIALFVERARLVAPNFRITDLSAPILARICQKLDGIPLAIELAAARVKVLSLEQISSRLDDRFRLLTGGSRRVLPRHQTLHAMIDWSYELLPEPEQLLFERLSVFSGGWTLEAVEAICAEGDVIDLLAQLVNKSLVLPVYLQGEVQRYQMLETIRQYAHEKLALSDEAEILRDRHLNFFLQFAEASETELGGPKMAAKVVQLDDELDNLRVAIGWALENSNHAQVERGLHLATSLAEYWMVRNLAGEGCEWLKKGLAILTGEDNRWFAIRSLASYMASFLIHWTSDFSRYPEARQLLEESIHLSSICGDKLGLAKAQCLLGFNLVAKYSLSSRTTTSRKEYQPAQSLGLEGLATCRELGDETDLVLALFWNGQIAYYGGMLDSAQRYIEESCALLEKTGNRLYQGPILAALGFITLENGNLAAARRHFQNSLPIAQEVNDKNTITSIYAYSGLTAYFQQDFRQMGADFQTALSLSRETGNKTWRMFSLRNSGIAALRQGRWQQAVVFFDENLQFAQKTTRYEYDLQVFLMCMAGVAAYLRRYASAARLLGATEALFESFFKPLDDWDQIEFNRIAALTKAHLNERELANAWADGRELTLDQAISYAKEATSKWPESLD